FVGLLGRLAGRRFIDWRRLQKESNELRAQIKTRKMNWPPPSAASPLLKGTAPAISAVDPMSAIVAAELPSIRSLFGRAFARIAAGQGPPDARAQQQFLYALATTYHSVLVWREHSRHVLRIDATLLEDLAHGEPSR